MVIKAVVTFLKELVLQPKLPPQLETFGYIEQAIIDGSLDKAYELVSRLEQENFQVYPEHGNYYRISNLIYKSRILTLKGEFNDGLEIGQTARKESVEHEFDVLHSSALIAVAEALIEKGQADESLEIINAGEEQVKQLKRRFKLEYNSDLATLNWIKSKVYKTKGELDEAIDCLSTCIRIRDEIGNLYETAQPLMTLGIIYAQRGELDQALNSFNQSLERFKLTNNEGQMLKLYNNIGMLYRIQGEPDAAIEQFKNALALSEKMGNKRNIGSIQLNMGLIYQDFGDLENSLTHFEESRKIFEELDIKQFLAQSLTNIGGIHVTKGDLELGLDYHSQSLALSIKVDNKESIGISNVNIGQIYDQSGDYEKAIEYYQEALTVFEGIDENTDHIGTTLFNVIQASLHLQHIEQAQEYLPRLEEFQTRVSTKLNNQMYLLAKGLILSTSERVVQKAEAQQIFQEIADGKVINQDNTTLAMIELCNLLLQELKISASEEVLSEFRVLIDKLYNISSDISSAAVYQYPTRINVLLLRSKMSLIDLDVEHAQQLMGEAHELAESKGLSQLSEQISSEQTRLKDELLKYKQMVDSSATLYERLEQTKIENYLSKVGEMLKR
jgi:tetratricopeptide (TPR) repeat protein